MAELLQSAGLRLCRYLRLSAIVRDNINLMVKSCKSDDHILYGLFKNGDYSQFFLQIYKRAAPLF